jgi:hypothetical protein
VVEKRLEIGFRPDLNHREDMPPKRIIQTPDEMNAHCATGILIAAPHVVALMMYRLRLLDLVVTGLSIERMNEVQVIDQHSSRLHQDRLIQITEG